MTRYFYDCEFIDDGNQIDLISIGVVREDGFEFYAQNLDCRFWKADEWVRQNVFPNLTRFDTEKLQPIIEEHKEGGYGDWWGVGSLVSKLCYSQMAGKDYSVFDLSQPVELWGYYSAYDHVALCQLFGPMVRLPKGMPMYTRDLKQICDQMGNPRLPEQGKNEHHALRDARWNKQVYDFLTQRHDAHVVADPLTRIAHLYARLPRLKQVCGTIAPERVLISVVDELFDVRNAKHFCPGFGCLEEPPHFWATDNPHIPAEFEARCPEHADRRQHERRKVHDQHS